MKTEDGTCERSHDPSFACSKVERDACRIQMDKNKASRDRRMRIAKGGAPPTSQSEGERKPLGVCKYYSKDPANNTCRRGESCKFGHPQ